VIRCRTTTYQQGNYSAALTPAILTTLSNSQE
jgi:hypothetical protein